MATVICHRGAPLRWYAGDTIIGGQPAQKLLRTGTARGYTYPSSYSWNLAKVITRVVGDRVEVLANGQFYTLYDFAAQPGAAWLTVPVTPLGTCAQALVQVMVDSVGRQLVGGRSLRWFRMHLTRAAGTQMGTWSGRVYEQLGSLTYMQPQSPICHGTDPGYLGPFSSFQAPGWPGIGYNPTSGTLLGSTQVRAVAAGFTVYPNPSAGRGQLAVELPASLAPDAQLYLLDGLGRQVSRQKAVPGQPLDVRELAPGSYYLLLRDGPKLPLIQRLVID